jgi:hypothetical protein
MAISQQWSYKFRFFLHQLHFIEVCLLKFTKNIEVFKNFKVSLLMHAGFDGAVLDKSFITMSLNAGNFIKTTIIIVKSSLNVKHSIQQCSVYFEFEL